jgi:hypothetical protein
LRRSTTNWLADLGRGLPDSGQSRRQNPLTPSGMYKAFEVGFVEGFWRTANAPNAATPLDGFIQRRCCVLDRKSAIFYWPGVPESTHAETESVPANGITTGLPLVVSA